MGTKKNEGSFCLKFHGFFFVWVRFRLFVFQKKSFECSKDAIQSQVDRDGGPRLVSVAWMSFFDPGDGQSPTWTLNGPDFLVDFTRAAGSIFGKKAQNIDFFT